MKSLISSLLIGASVLATPVVAQEGSAPDPAAVLATVNGTDITLGHVIALASRLPEQYDQVEPDVLFNGILDQLVQQQLLAGQSDANSGVAKLSIENETRSVLATETLAGIADDAASEEAVLEAYAAEVDAFVPGQEFRASHILVETEEEAAELVATLDGGADFAELAREKSTGPSGPNGGDLGWFGPGAMVPPFDEAVQAMETGSIAGPVQTQFGWHVINLVETRGTQPPTLDERRAAIAQNLQQGAVQAFIAQLEADGDIERFTLDFDLQQIRNIDLIK